MEPTKQETLQPSPTREPRKPAIPRDPYAGYDLPLERRPGYGSLRGIEPWANSRWPVARQPRTIPFYAHGRSNKNFPPVFGTDCPPKGLSGLLRKLAYGYPDHMARHWLMLLASDRVDSAEYHVKKLLPLAAPALALGLIARAVVQRPRQLAFR